MKIGPRVVYAQKNRRPLAPPEPRGNNNMYKAVGWAGGVRLSRGSLAPPPHPRVDTPQGKGIHDEKALTLRPDVVLANEDAIETVVLTLAPLLQPPKFPRHLPFTTTA